MFAYNMYKNVSQQGGIALGFRLGEIIEIIYIDRYGELSQRWIRIISEENERLVAYCYAKRKVRSFLIKNILGMRKVNAS